MRTNLLFIIAMCIIQPACQAVVTPTMLPSPTKIAPTATLVPTLTAQPTAATGTPTTPLANSNVGAWNELQYDTDKWTVITYNDTEWTPQTYPVNTLAPVLAHKSIETCMMFPEEGSGLPGGWAYWEVPVIIGGHVIFDERIFMDETGQEMYIVIAGSYHVNFPHTDDKSDCINDAERVVMTGMEKQCLSGDCGYCPGLPPTNLRIGNMVQLVNPEMALPMTEPGGSNFVGAKMDWYFSVNDYLLQVINGPICANANAWWQLRNPSGITGWDSDDHFVVEP